MKFSLSVIGVCLATALVACGGGDPPDTNKKLVTSADITAFAGKVSPAYVDGTGTDAQFTYPTGMAVNSNGDLYVADQATVRKVTSAGVVTSPFGTVGLSLRGLVMDGDGNIYVSDSTAHVIRKVNSSGVISVYAGSGAAALTNGAGNAASFNAPYGLARDSTGNIYVADTNNHAIRKITTSGVVTTLAGNASGTPGYSDGNGGNASFNYPRGVAVDSHGNVIVADSNNQVIRRIAPNGDVSTIAGTVNETLAIPTDGDGIGAAARFNIPSGVAVDSFDNIYVADTGNNMIRRITPAGMVITLAGNGSQGPANGSGYAARFYGPTSIAVATGGIFYIADSANYTIRKMTITTK